MLQHADLDEIYKPVVSANSLHSYTDICGVEGGRAGEQRTEKPQQKMTWKAEAGGLNRFEEGG